MTANSESASTGERTAAETPEKVATEAAHAAIFKHHAMTGVEPSASYLGREIVAALRESGLLAVPATPRDAMDGIMSAMGGLKLCDPTFTMTDGVVTMDWPDEEARATIVTREIIEQMVETKNNLTELERAVTELAPATPNADALNDAWVLQYRSDAYRTMMEGVVPPDQPERIARLAGEVLTRGYALRAALAVASDPTNGTTE